MADILDKRPMNAEMTIFKTEVEPNKLNACIDNILMRVDRLETKFADVQPADRWISVEDRSPDGENNMEELIYFELNNWFSGRDYPNEEPFISWIKDNKFSNDEWCIQNKLVVLAGYVDMSKNWCITATKEWVELNCPKLLEDHFCIYTIITHTYNKELGKPMDMITEHSCNMTDFLRHPDEDGEVYGRFDWHFPEYNSDNYGVIWQDEEE